MPVHTPGAINSSGDRDHGIQQDQTAVAYPNSVDSFAGMQYPDQAGGPVANAPRSGQQEISAPAGTPGEHFDTFVTPAVRDPRLAGFNVNGHGPIVGNNATKVPDLPQYGTIGLLGTSYETREEE